MSDHDDVVLTRTTYNLLAILGWIGVASGLVAGVIQIWEPTEVGIALLAVGLIAGGVTVSNAGPVQRKSQQKVRLSRAQAKPESR